MPIVIFVFPSKSMAIFLTTPFNSTLHYTCVIYDPNVIKTSLEPEDKLQQVYKSIMRTDQWVSE